MSLRVVNFGRRKASLSTVGYTLYNSAGAEQQARSTSGVVELGTTGIYIASIGVSSETIVVWDTGEATPLYATEPLSPILNGIREETDHIRLIWNSLRNQGVVYNKILDNFRDIKKLLSGKKPDILPKIEKIINSQPTLALTDIEGLIKGIPTPIVNIPKTYIPDYSKQIIEMNKALNRITIFEKKIADRSQNIIESIKKGNGEVLQKNVSSLLREIGQLQSAIINNKTSLNQMNTNITETVKPSKFLKEIHSILEMSKSLKEQKEEYDKKDKKMKLAGLY